MRRAKKKVKRNASSIFVTAKVVMLPISTARYRFTNSIFPCRQAGSKMRFFNLAADCFLRARSTVASVANRLQEPARELGNSIRLPSPDRLSRDQLSTNP
jgi:hypothetical protein